jgi:pyruvate/2-oxoglutarate dehydrogenase complex dihydrolipoamide dehydrogenase (E3) component
MTEAFDAIVLGMGPGGEATAYRLLNAGKRVAVVERELIGGECAYWACIPSKTLLRPPEAKSQAGRSAGVTTPELDWAETAAYRDYMTRHLDDHAQVREYQDQGALVVRGAGRLTGPGRVEVEGQQLTAEHIILATGSEPALPPIEGLDEVEVWTNREATQLREIPERAVIVGGGPVCIELGQFLARFGCKVTVVQSADRLINREDPRVGELIAETLVAEGIDVLVGRQVAKVAKRDGATLVELNDGTTIRSDVIVLAAGRSPRVRDLGLETVGVEFDGGSAKRGVPVNEYCQVTEGLWATGDVTGVGLFTHVAKYQARIVAANILGRPRPASYRGVPRVVFSDPEIAAVGLTEAQAREQGHEVATVTVALPEAIARPWTYERDPKGELGLIADPRRGVLLGAWAFAPLAGEWIHQAALAVRAEIPLDVLLDGVAQFPTYTEAYLAGLEQLVP